MTRNESTRRERYLQFSIALLFVAMGATTVYARLSQPRMPATIWAAKPDCRTPAVKKMPAQLRTICRTGVFINRDNIEDIAFLPGIGPKRAQTIVADREKNGPFACPRDLIRVKGIGPKTVARIIPWLEKSDFKGTCTILPDKLE